MFTKETIPAEIPVLKDYADYLCYNCIPADKPASQMSLEELHQDQPSWDIASMIRGLNRLSEIAADGPCLYNVYTPDESSDCPEKKDVKVWFMPTKGTSPSKSPWIISCVGGAYTCVCSLVESFPTAARFNELGYNVFVLTYRVLQPELMPMPLDDLAAAIRFILLNRKKFQLSSDEYIVNGFSAGANLTCLWGTVSKGWAHYGLPRPKALFPIYPVTTFDGMYTEGNNFFLKVMFGEDFDKKTAETYDVSHILSDNYPPCYLVHAKDDPVVSCQHSVLLKNLLDSRHIPAVLELVEHGKHGFGDGSGTDAAHWMDRAAAWENTL